MHRDGVVGERAEAALSTMFEAYPAWHVCAVGGHRLLRHFSLTQNIHPGKIFLLWPNPFTFAPE
jgi:hypothetical protein